MSKHLETNATRSSKVFQRVVAKIRKAALEPIGEIVSHFDSESDAFQFEIGLIAKYGRRDLGKGTLCNLTDGGEGPSGSLGMRKKLDADPVFALAHADRLRDKHSDTKFHDAYLAGIKRRDADPVWITAHATRMKERNADPVFRSAHADGIRKRDANPQKYSALVEHLDRLRSDPSTVAKCAEACRERNADPVFKAASAEACRERNSDPVFIERNRQHNADPVFKANRMRGLHAYWAARRAAKEAALTEPPQSPV